MLFATNRMPRQSARSRRNRKLTFDNQNTTVSQNMFFCRRDSAGDYTEIMSEAFFDELKKLQGKTRVLLYIQGFNNNMESEIFPNAEKLQRAMDDVGGEGLVHVVPLIWPCDDDSPLAFIDDYWDDQDAADNSGTAFARALGMFDDWRRREAESESPCTRRISILAHSMGNRVLQNALNHWAGNINNGTMPQMFTNIFMVAADVVNEALEEGKSGQYIVHAARNVVVYYANDDLAMPASKLANTKNKTVSRRMGMTGPENIGKLPRKVYEVDCDNFNNTLDPPKGHSYFLYGPDGETVSPVIGHMVSALTNGRVEPDQQHHELPRPPMHN
jgi:esterase/lipase superfamily enzyme